MKPSGNTAFVTSCIAATVAALFAATPVFAQATVRVRGTITELHEGSITVKDRDVHTVVLKTGADTKYVEVVASSLDAIKLNEYVGTAVKGPQDHLIAVEIVIVPENMRAGRIGYYTWDPLPDTSGIDVSGTATTNTVNGLVSSVSTTKLPLTNTIMTNGTVTGIENRTAGRTLTVALANNTTAHILVSPTAPIVRFVPSDRSAISVNSTVVVWTVVGSPATLVAVGKGITPPM